MEQTSVVAGFTGTQRGMTVSQFDTVKLVTGALFVERAHHGDCIGADEQFHRIARSLHCLITIHPPDKPGMRAWCEGDELRDEFPYLVRNQHIVDEATVLIAAPSGQTELRRSGTWSTVRKARKKDIPIIIVFPNGAIRQEGQ